MSAILYRNFEGREVTHGSYSARETFHFCPRKFELSRIAGWREKEKRASTEFGHAIEDALCYHEGAGREPGTAVRQFAVLWNRMREQAGFKDWTYTDAEVSWDGLLRAGKELAMLYELRAPSLPISTVPRAQWQTKVTKRLFPRLRDGGDNHQPDFSLLDNTAVLDIISWPAWDHPLLPKIEQEHGKWEGGTTNVITRQLIIDCKTSGKDLTEDLVGLDPQLIEYAWQMRIPDMAFLWLVKKSHKLERRNRVTLLKAVGGHSAGTELYILANRKEQGLVFLGDKDALRIYGEATKGMNANSNAYEAAEDAFFQAAFVVSCPPATITKQRLQFAAARISTQDMDEAGREIGRTTLEMVRAHEEGFYPRTGGIRWPNDKCCNCAMRGICADKPELRDRLLTRTGEEWMEVSED